MSQLRPWASRARQGAANEANPQPGLGNTMILVVERFLVHNAEEDRRFKIVIARGGQTKEQSLADAVHDGRSSSRLRESKGHA